MPGNSSRSRRIAPEPDETMAEQFNDDYDGCCAVDEAAVDARYGAVFRTVMREKSDGAKRLAIRAAAGISLAGKRQLRNAVNCATLKSKEGQAAGLNFLKASSGGCLKGFSLIPIWHKSLRSLEGMYGSGVLSFFIFLKSLFTLNILLSLLTGLFVIAPQAVSSSQYQAMLTGLRASADTNLSGSCSELYAANLSASAAGSSTVAKILDVIQGTGTLENTILFLGYYFPTQVTIGSVGYNMPVAYLIVTGVAFFISLLFMLDRTGAAFKEVVVQRASGAASGAPFSALVLSGCDHGLAQPKAAGLARRILRNNLMAELDLHRMLERRLNGGCGRGCCLAMKRVLVNAGVLACLGGSGYAIYLAQNLSLEYTTSNSSSSGNWIYFAYQYLPAVVVSVLAGALPAVFGLLVRLEEYTPDTELAVTLGRCIFLRLANLAVLVASIYAVIAGGSLGVCGGGGVTCWETYVGQAFYKLEVTFLAVHLVVCFLLELPRSLIGRKCPCRLAKLIGPPEFDIADSVLQVLYAQIIVWFGMLFCPFLPAINAVVLFVLFYLRKFSCHFSYQPPERPLKNSSATAFFMVTLFLAYFLCVIPIGYLIVALPTSKSCSPFRTGDVAYRSISGLVASFGTEARQLLGYLGSAGFLFVLVVALLIAIYYYRTLAIARQEIGLQRLRQLAEQDHLKFARLHSAEPLTTELSEARALVRGKAAGNGDATTPV